MKLKSKAPAKTATAAARIVATADNPFIVIGSRGTSMPVLMKQLGWNPKGENANDPFPLKEGMNAALTRTRGATPEWQNHPEYEGAALFLISHAWISSRKDDGIYKGGQFEVYRLSEALRLKKVKEVKGFITSDGGTIEATGYLPHWWNSAQAIPQYVAIKRTKDWDEGRVESKPFRQNGKLVNEAVYGQFTLERPAAKAPKQKEAKAPAKVEPKAPVKPVKTKEEGSAILKATAKKLAEHAKQMRLSSKLPAKAKV